MYLPQNDVCFPPTASVTKATKYHYPSITSYTGATCTGTATVTTVDDVCYPVETYPVGNSNNLVRS